MGGRNPRPGVRDRRRDRHQSDRGHRRRRVRGALEAVLLLTPTVLAQWSPAFRRPRSAKVLRRPLLNSSAWNADAVRDDLRAYVVEQLGGTNGVLIVDETGFLKKGERSAGVQRQYSSTAGSRTARSACSSPTPHLGGGALIDRELYLPKSWAADPERRARAAIPEEVAFAIEPAMARATLERTLVAGVPARWITAGEACDVPGHHLRSVLRRRAAGRW
ncbi:transposase [Streptosporangium sp. NPDC002524]|uniref:transposase n=1 Tax=Streptosporangium sp. NPDC002524 TaxID=3154537 RepID=UPI0033186CEF